MLFLCRNSSSTLAMSCVDKGAEHGTRDSPSSAIFTAMNVINFVRRPELKGDDARCACTGIATKERVSQCRLVWRLGHGLSNSLTLAMCVCPCSVLLSLCKLCIRALASLPALALPSRCVFVPQRSLGEQARGTVPAGAV